MVDIQDGGDPPVLLRPTARVRTAAVAAVAVAAAALRCFIGNEW